VCECVFVCECIYFGVGTVGIK